MTRPSDDKLKDVTDFDPDVGRYVSELEKQNKELTAKAATAPAVPKAFEPERFDPEIQQEIDAVPEMLAMQMNPDQTAFKLAKGMDTVLRQHPVWSLKTVQERFAEVTRRVQADLGSTPAAPSPQPPAPNAQEVARQAAIAKANQAAAPAPLAIGDLRGGNTPSNDPPSYDGMTEADIMADLDRYA